MRKYLAAALALGIAPIVLGALIFALWVWLRAGWLMGAGCVLLYAGPVATVLGALCLGVYTWRSWRAEATPPRRLLWQNAVVIVLFLSNYLFAAGAVFGAVLIETRYTVRITNETDVPLEAVRIEGGGVDVRVDSIEPGDTAKRSFWIEQDGELRLHAIQGERQIRETIDSYVTDGLGGDLLVTLEPEGRVLVTNRRTGTTAANWRQEL